MKRDYLNEREVFGHHKQKFSISKKIKAGYILWGGERIILYMGCIMHVTNVS